MAKFDMGEAWKQVVAMFKGNRDILLAVGGLFLFLPTLAFGLYYGVPPEPAAGASPEQAFTQVFEYYQLVAPGLLVVSVVSMIGNLVIWRLLLAPGGTTLGGAIGTAASLFFSYLAASFLTGIPIMFGLFLLIIPGLYLASRFSLVGPAMAAEQLMNPITAIQASWNYTRNNGWSILGFLIVFGLLCGIGVVIITAIFGAIFALALPQGAANIANQVVQALFSTAFSVTVTLVIASIYRQLGPTKSVETFK